jgi:hypothetical protein
MAEQSAAARRYAKNGGEKDDSSRETVRMSPRDGNKDDNRPSKTEEKPGQNENRERSGGAETVHERHHAERETLARTHERERREEHGHHKDRMAAMMGRHEAAWKDLHMRHEKEAMASEQPKAME